MGLNGKAFDLESAAVSKLASSGLTVEHGIALGMSAEDPAPDGLPLRSAGLRIPYHSPAGEDTGFFRFRFLEPPPKAKGFGALAPAKPIRYAQPAGTLPRVYFPRLEGFDWPALLANTSEQLLITEGELKAASACAAGFATLGLGGVWSWRAGNQGLELLPELGAISWKARPVVIVYDSDAVSNDKVIAAENALARKLSSLGARVSIARLPKLADCDKTGLDDFLVARGPDALEAVLLAAHAWVAFEPLHALNEEVTYLRDQGRVLRYSNGSLLDPNSFVNHVFAPRRYMDYSGKTPKEKSAPAEWLKWEGRSEVGGLTFVPGADERIVQNGEPFINTWKGWGTTPQKGDISVWRRLTKHLFGEDEAARVWFEQWCAYPIQHPGTKLYTAAMLWGVQKGTGKTAIAYMLGKIHGKGFIEIKNRDLVGGFNGWVASRTLVYGDEITGSDARHDADYMKGLITQSHARINEKFQVPYVLPDCANYLFTSNHPNALFLEDGDRRYFIHEVKASPLPQVFYDEMDDWMHSGTGINALHHHLLHLSLSGFHPRAKALETSSKEDMIEMGRSELSSWVRQLKNDPTSICVLGGHTCCLFTSQELLSLYDPANSKRVTKTTMARELTRQGFKRAAKGYPMRLPNGQHRLWIVYGNKGVEAASGAEVIAQYIAERKLAARKGLVR